MGMDRHLLSARGTSDELVLFCFCGRKFVR
nr:MAG TPA: hypothetical protein [Bacteriophage sp.]